MDNIDENVFHFIEFDSVDQWEKIEDQLGWA